MNKIRDFLYTHVHLWTAFYGQKAEIFERVVQFPDKRILSFEIATKMNLLQEDYATRLSESRETDDCRSFLPSVVP